MRVVCFSYHAGGGYGSAAVMQIRAIRGRIDPTTC
jgi:hypothetical protein